MIKDNKIISFEDRKNRKKPEYSLKSEITVYICRNVETYKCDCYCQDEEITKEEIFEILKRIFYKLTEQIHEIKMKKVDYYEITFTLFYYEDIHNSCNFKYLCIPQDLEPEKLTEYLYTFISIYEYKTATK